VSWMVIKTNKNHISIIAALQSELSRHL